MSPEERKIQYWKIKLAVGFGIYFLIWSLMVLILLNR